MPHDEACVNIPDARALESVQAGAQTEARGVRTKSALGDRSSCAQALALCTFI